MNNAYSHDIKKTLLHFDIELNRDAVITPLTHNSSLYRINQNESILLLKKYNILTADRLEKINKILEICTANQTTPFTYKTVESNFVLKINDSYYSLLDYISGTRPTINNKYSDIAKLIAQMHIGLSGLHHDNLSHPLYLDISTVHDMLSRFKLDYLLPILEQAESIKHTVRWQIIHNDLHPNNIIQSQSDKFYIIDFESFSANTLILDVFFAAYRLFGSINKMFYKFIDFYDEHNRLYSQEKNYGLLLLASDVIRKLGFIISEYYNGNTLYYDKDFIKYKRFADQLCQNCITLNKCVNFS